MKGIRERRDIFYHSFYDDLSQWFLIQLMQPNQRSCSQLENLNNKKKEQKKKQNNTSAHERILNCAYDDRSSFLAIGGLGVAVLLIRRIDYHSRLRSNFPQQKTYMW